MNLWVDSGKAELQRLQVEGGRFADYARHVVLDLALELPPGARAEVRSPEDRVVALTGYPQWETFEITMQVDNSAGEPALTALAMRPHPGSKEKTPIDGQRLASLPTRRIARIATQALLLGSIGSAHTRASPGTIPRRPRRGDDSFSRLVADVVRTAQAFGVPIQKAVATTFGVTAQPTAERYIREARNRGFLAESDRSAASRR